MFVAFRFTCCLCRKNIPLARDVIALDDERQRRYPNMRGTLACERCVIDYGWNCGFVDGHVAAPEDEVDSWSHHLERGTHRAPMQCHPRSGLLQGAEAYLRSVATRKGADPEFAAMLRTVTQEWHEQHSATGAPQPVTA
ncbi:hypothetical protein ACIA8I_32295 [Streptomyces rishiriensis]|uniref:hypothetical protein n=1 Tax=Streptomyces rishiriensis TaxID=68264 RepID=UPI0037ADF186